MSSLASLPDEVLKLVMQHVPVADRLGSCCLVCRRLHAAAVAATQRMCLVESRWQCRFEWLLHYGHHVTSLEVNLSTHPVSQIPCPNLLELECFHCSVQLGPAADGSPVCLWTAYPGAGGHLRWVKSFGRTRAPVAHTVQTGARCGAAVFVTAVQRLHAVGVGAKVVQLALQAVSERPELITCTKADLAADWCKPNLDYMNVNLLSGMIRALGNACSLVKAPLAGAVEVAAHALERQLRSGGVCLWLIKRPAKSPHYLCSYVSEGRAYLSDPLKEYPEEQGDVTQWCRHLAGWVGSDNTLWAVIASRTASSCDPCPDMAAAMLVDFFTNEKGPAQGGAGAPSYPALQSFPSRPGSSKRGYRPSTSARRTTSSRAGEATIDPFAPIKVVDDQGVNRTPKPLVAIVTSAALRQARYLGMQESVLGSETSEALLGEVSSTAFGRGWFDCTSVTPQESSNDLDYSPGGRGLAPAAAAIMGEASSRMLRGTNSGSNKSGFSPSTSQRPTRTPPESGDGGREPGLATADMRVLTDSDLAARHDVVLQDSGAIIMLEMPGIVVAADTPEGSQALAANQRYTECLAEAASSDKCSTSYSQTPIVLLKHKEVQSGSSSNQTVACQATGYDIHDSYALLNKDQGDEADDQLGSVLPSGAVVSAGNSAPGNQSSSLSASFIRSSTQQFRPSSMSSMRSSMAGWGGEHSTYSRPASSRGSDRGGAATDSNAAAVALLAAEEVKEEPWTQLQGIAEVLEVMEAAVSQNIYLPQLMLYRDIKLPPPLVVSFDLGGGGADGLSAVPSNPLTGAGSGQLNLASPGLPSRPSLCSTPGSSRPTGEQPWSAAHTPHGGSTIGHSGAHGSLAGMSNPSMSGARPSVMGGAGSMSGLGAASLLSRRPSYQVGHAELGSSPSRQSSIMSMGSSRVFRSNRPPASLQQLWTWSCSLTEGRPVSSMAWNSSNNNLMAAGYRTRPSADSAQAAGTAGGSAFAQGQQGSIVGQGALLSAPRPAAGDAAGGESSDGAAAVDLDGAGGCVALWSLKNQFYPVWSFKTKAGVTSLDFSQRNPHMLGVGMHDGTIAVYDVRSRQATPVLASTAETGKHADPVWKVRWVDPGPEREEQLVSISTDGKVKAWTVAKGLEHNTLITLKRVPHRLIASAGSNRGGSGGTLAAGAAAAAAAAAMAATGSVPAGSGAKAAVTVAALRGDGSGSRGAVINRNTGGMSFDFSSVDRRMYLAGTEDGHIHKCSTSYSEQYLETYHGHIGPVYALQWSPFNPSLFLSCSADWTIRMWQEGRQQPLMTFQSSNKEVFDVAWCPSNSTVFAAVTADGRLELWDFAVSTLRPVCQHAVTKTAMTALLFAKDAPVIVSATDAGALQVYRLVNIAADRFEPPELQHARLEEALRANIMKAALVGS